MKILEVDVEFDGAVVAAIDFVMYFRGFNALHEALAHEEIVDAPAGVGGPSVKAVAPPGVFPFRRMQSPKSVDEPD